VDAAKFTYEKKHLTLYDIANYVKYQLDFGEDHTPIEEIWEYIEKEYWTCIERFLKQNGQPKLDFVAFHSLNRPLIRHNITNGIVTVNQQVVYDPVTKSPMFEEDIVILEPDLIPGKPPLLGQTPLAPGGRPVTNFGLKSRQRKTVVFSQDTKEELDEMCSVNAKEIKMHSRSCIEFRGKLFRFRYWTKKDPKKVFQSKYCNHCKVFYHKEDKQWKGTLIHIEQCPN
jgi:hypothetical protein